MLGKGEEWRKQFTRFVLVGRISYLRSKISPSPNLAIMPAMTFNERQSKYRHCCCHIRVAAYVTGILQLLAVLYILVQHSVRSIISDFQQNDEKTASSSTTNAGYSRRWLGPSATTPLVTWAVCESLFLSLMFYGIAKGRPWLLVPQLFLQIVTIIVCMILNILMVCVLAWHPNVNEIWYFLTAAVLFAFLYEYGLIVLIRCYRYLRDKALFEAQCSTRGVYVLPTRALNGEMIIPDHLVESRMYTDTPPDYSLAITMMTVEEAEKNPDTAVKRKPDPIMHVRHENIGQQETSSQQSPDECEEAVPPPTYEQARELQNASSTPK